MTAGKLNRQALLRTPRHGNYPNHPHDLDTKCSTLQSLYELLPELRAYTLSQVSLLSPELFDTFQEAFNVLLLVEKG
jgi:hypothetical protein